MIRLLGTIGLVHAAGPCADPAAFQADASSTIIGAFPCSRRNSTNRRARRWGAWFLMRAGTGTPGRITASACRCRTQKPAWPRFLVSSRTDARGARSMEA